MSNIIEDETKKPQTREERIAAYQAAKKVHDARVLELTSFRVGDTVAVGSRWGMHFLSGVPATIEKIDLDHGHAAPNCAPGHTHACYVAERVELSLVWGAKTDGSADCRSREKASHCYKVVDGIATETKAVRS